MSSLSDEELACFSDLFATSLTGDKRQSGHTDADILAENSLSVSTEIPQVLANILGESKLTLLAEISHYRLWFPLVLKRDELGQFIPVLGVPEVVDTSGAERSWRITDLKNVTVIDNNSQQPVEVLSLSSSGLTFKMHDERHANIPTSGKLMLSNGLEVDVDFEPVRAENGVMAAKINAKGDAREALRQFLFSAHKAKYSHLYKV
ncbi:hypothetical protein [Shewanella aestuarii]|uniref:PilZ domain-containing protein n=1 Tax=Shewanella aestuarii TaxID=1028752 RepID=A0A6G9QGR0_9GAMM|nr:hypothetical protein [Shewanella aestuarii]QIR13710.1 hypothetical protein HBH39_03650 [Shewanella aestuarii]